MDEIKNCKCGYVQQKNFLNVKTVCNINKKIGKYYDFRN